MLWFGPILLVFTIGCHAGGGIPKAFRGWPVVIVLMPCGAGVVEFDQRQGADFR
jgi:hypothetical protein